MAAASLHSLSANKAKVIHVPNTLEKDEYAKIKHASTNTDSIQHVKMEHHTWEQKEISLKLFSMTTFLVSGLTKKI